MVQNYQNIFYGLTNSELALLIAFAVLFLFRFIYLFFFTGKALFKKRKTNTTVEKPPFSIILTIRNEEEKLKKNLPKILGINSVDFEMVVVDDFSQDSSYLILGLLRDRYKRLTISSLNQETRFSMKLAQNIAIKATKTDWVLSVPVSVSKPTAGWLEKVAETTGQNKNLIVAYSSVEAQKGFYNQLFRIENYYSFLSSTAYILNGVSMVFSDENVAFRKENYFKLGGHRQNMNEPYANLELVFNAFIRKKTTTVLFSGEATIRKAEEIGKTEYFDLLKKWIRIEKHLPFTKKTILFFDEFTKLIYLPFSALVIVLFPELWILLASLLGFKFLAHLVIIKLTQNRLNERKIFIPSLVYELIMPYYKLFFRWYFNRHSKKNRWRNKV